MNWQMIAFFVLAGITLYSAYRVAVDENITHAALYLAIAFVGVAGFFLLLGAEFLAAVQVLVYVGAVMTVMIFAIMLSDMRAVRGERKSLVRKLISPYWGALPLAVAALFVVLVLAAWASSPVATTAGAREVTVKELGKALLTTYVVPFEVASVLLLAAMVGAVVIGKREGDG